MTITVNCLNLARSATVWWHLYQRMTHAYKPYAIRQIP
jgi:hypothetical protein